MVGRRTSHFKGLKAFDLFEKRLKSGHVDTWDLEFSNP